MSSFQDNMNEYRKQLEKGAIQKAYQGLMDYIMGLWSYFENKYPNYSVSGSVYRARYYCSLSPQLTTAEFKLFCQNTPKSCMKLRREVGFEPTSNGDPKVVS
jgi:hypothetical protein